MSVATHFAQSYAEARAKFRAAAEEAGLQVQSHRHPLLGRDGETLAMDVVRCGPPDARALLLLSSACHGVEGFCGSAVQTALLRERAWRAEAAAAGVAVLYVHALNPYGFSWWRRTTHENVDLNRNFRDFSQPAPRNERYDEIAGLVVPAQWPPAPEVERRLESLRSAWGDRAFQQALTGGQYAHPQGLFYGGLNPTWSHRTLREVLQQHAQRCERLGWIDLHTGLGPQGHGERIFAGRNDAAALARARDWWGAQVTSIYDGSSSATELAGLMFNVVDDACPQAQYTGIALEYGTVPMEETLQALRAEQWLENHPETPETQARPIKQRLRDAFYIDTDAWKQRVTEQAFDAARQALRGLAGAPAP